jgi:hypothetical protein
MAGVQQHLLSIVEPGQLRTLGQRPKQLKGSMRRKMTAIDISRIVLLEVRLAAEQYCAG